jgi:hypothetical protein
LRPTEDEDAARRRIGITPTLALREGGNARLGCGIWDQRNVEAPPRIPSWFRKSRRVEDVLDNLNNGGNFALLNWLHSTLTCTTPQHRYWLIVGVSRLTMREGLLYLQYAGQTDGIWS